MSYTPEQKAEIERLIDEGKFTLARIKARMYAEQQQQQQK